MKIHVYRDYDCKKVVDTYISNVVSAEKLIQDIYKTRDPTDKVVQYHDEPSRIDIYKFNKAQPPKTTSDEYEWIECHYIGTCNYHMLCQHNECCNIKTTTCKCGKYLCDSCAPDHILWHNRCCPLNGIQRLKSSSKAELWFQNSECNVRRKREMLEKEERWMNGKWRREEERRIIHMWIKVYRDLDIPISYKSASKVATHSHNMFKYVPTKSNE